MPGRQIRRSRGSVVIEFALVLPIFLTLLLFTVRVGAFFYARQALLFAAEATARQVAVAEAQFDADAYLDQRLTDAGMDPGQVVRQWQDNGVVSTYAQAIESGAGSMLTLTLQHTPSAWLQFWASGKQGVRVVVHKEGARTCP
jgi:Flp pilus assembly protein TadG